MINFPKDFFETEVREEFTIDSTMKTVWAAEIEVLAAIASVCEKYQLPWYADWGTLLGAVRHNGFIPWDDDMDICMLREDYQKLMEVLPSELPKGWKVYNYMSGNPQEQFWACVMNSDRISIESDRLRQFHGCPFIVGVDIYPLDFLPKNDAEVQMEEAIINLIWKSVQLFKKEEKTEEDEKDLSEAIGVINDCCNINLEIKPGLTTELWKLANEICMAYNGEDGDELIMYIAYLKDKKMIYKKEWFDDVEYFPFESVYVPVPIGYDELLKCKYGDYSVRVRNTQSHEYPYYNKQLEQMREIVKKMEEENRGVQDD